MAPPQGGAFDFQHKLLDRIDGALEQRSTIGISKKEIPVFDAHEYTVEVRQRLHSITRTADRLVADSCSSQAGSERSEYWGSPLSP